MIRRRESSNFPEVRTSGLFSNYSGCQSNVPFAPPDNLVYVGKNSQIKARKSEHGYGLKNILLQYDFILPVAAL